MRNRRRNLSSPRYAPFLSSQLGFLASSQNRSNSRAPRPSSNPIYHPNHSYHTTPPDATTHSDSSQNGQSGSQEAGPADAETSPVPVEVCRLRIDNTYLLEQNRALSQELAQAKLTAHALRQIIIKKDNEVTKLRQDNRRLILKQTSFGNELTSELTLTRSTQPQSKFFKEENITSKEI